MKKLDITAIRITTHTKDKPFLFEAYFESKLNIIRGDNAKGKSTLVQSIFYVLGQEELLGGKNSKVMQSCLRKLIRDDEENEITVLGSSIELQLFNGVDTVTLKRCTDLDGTDDRLIEVTFGAALSIKDLAFKKESMFVHDAGGATNSYHGFHKWLEEFLGWELPSVASSGEKEFKLYSQLIFPAFLIEQKAGWSNYLATSPYYGIRESKKRAIEFLLNLDVSQNEKSKRQNEAKLESCKKEWQTIYDEIERLIARDFIKIVSLNRYPHADFDPSKVNLVYERDVVHCNLQEQINKLEHDLNDKKLAHLPTNHEAEGELNQKLEELLIYIQNLTDEEDAIRSFLALEHSQKKDRQETLNEIEKEIEKNEGALKVKKFGATLESELAAGNCPTCHQEIKDALLPLDISAIPMSIEDNVNYLKGQKKIFLSYIESCFKTVTDLNNRLKQNRKLQQETREQIKAFRLQLTADPRLPSMIDLREQIKQEGDIKKFNGYLEFFNKKTTEILAIHHNYKLALDEKKNLPQNGLSQRDKQKLDSFSEHFRGLLRKFEFQSCNIDFIRISEESYFPIIDSSELLNEVLRHDSSASDFIRVMWSYTIGLYLVSEQYQANHPSFIFFDEPAQHSISDKNCWDLFDTLSKLNCQTIVADSFNNNDQNFVDTTQGINFNLIKFEGRLLKRS
jgi:hypothetical protein